MGRPPKFPTPQDAAEHYLHTRGPTPIGMGVKDFIALITQRCDLCGQLPKDTYTVNRIDGSHTVTYNYLEIDQTGQVRPLCKTCRTLLGLHDLKDLLSHCARIMARRKWGVTNRWFSQAQD